MVNKDWLLRRPYMRYFVAAKKILRDWEFSFAHVLGFVVLLAVYTVMYQYVLKPLTWDGD